MLDERAACGLLDGEREPRGGAQFAHGEGVRVERVSLCGVELDESSDRGGARPREGKLR